MSRALSRKRSNSGRRLTDSARRSMKLARTWLSAFCNGASRSASWTLSLKCDDVGSALTFRLELRRADRRLFDHSGQYFGDVADGDGLAFAQELAGHVHQAADVAGKQGRRAAGDDVRRLLGHDGVGELAKFDGESPAESTANIGRFHLDELQAGDAGEQLARLARNAKLAQARARIVIGDGALETRVDLLDAENVDEEADKLMAFARKAPRLAGHFRLPGKKLAIVLGEHAGA